MTEQRLRDIAEFLFQRLDDIDTLYDACKGDKEAFYAQVARVHRRRFEVAWTDGYKVHFAESAEAARAGAEAHFARVMAEQSAAPESAP